MALKQLETKLAQLLRTSCASVEADEYEQPPTDSIYAVGTRLRFGEGTRLAAQFWRFIKGGKPLVSIFDHRQKYG